MKRAFLLAVALALVGAVSASADNPIVLMETSMGNIKVELNPEKAPATVENFLTYVKDKHYDGTIFHRVMKGFMIQGGGFADGKEKATRDGVKNEASNGLGNLRGTIAMARTNDPHSATAQFFINHRDNPSLNPGGVDPAGYTVFGRVIEGLDVVDEIASVRTTTKTMTARNGRRGPFENVPAEDVVIKTVRRVQ